MLIISGNVNGEIFEEKVVTNKFVMDKFGVPPIKGAAVFRVTSSSHVKRNRGDGRVLVTPGKKVTPAFTVSTPEGQFTLRYAETKQLAKGGIGHVYTPKKVQMLSGDDSFSVTDQNIDLYVWLYLHPYNKVSPFERSSIYTYWDPIADAKKGMDAVQAEIDLIMEMSGMNSSDLRLRAAGMHYRARVGGSVATITIPGATSSPIEVVRVNLMQALKRDGKAFIDAWNSTESSVLGIARMAEQLGIIEQKPVGQNIVWAYSHEYGGAKIVSVRNDADPQQMLISELTARYNDYIPNLRNLISLSAPSTPEATKPLPETAPKKDAVLLVDDMTLAQVIESGNDTIIAYDRSSQSVWTLDKNGELETNLLSCAFPEWKASAAGFLASDEGVEWNNKLRTRLKKILKQK